MSRRIPPPADTRYRWARKNERLTESHRFQYGDGVLYPIVPDFLGRRSGDVVSNWPGKGARDLYYSGYVALRKRKGVKRAR